MKSEELKKCNTCKYMTTQEFNTDAKGEIVGKFYPGRRFKTPFAVCKLLELVCCEVENCPLSQLTEKEIEERVDSYDNI